MFEGVAVLDGWGDDTGSHEAIELIAMGSPGRARRNQLGDNAPVGRDDDTFAGLDLPDVTAEVVFQLSDTRLHDSYYSHKWPQAGVASEVVAHASCDFFGALGQGGSGEQQSNSRFHHRQVYFLRGPLGSLRGSRTGYMRGQTLGTSFWNSSIWRRRRSSMAGCAEARLLDS